MEKKLFAYLKNKSDGSASSSEIIKDLSLKITYADFNSIVENLYYRGLILTPHKQNGFSSGLKYDLITISTAGLKFIH